ncbi:Enteropeptidase, partial [Pseudolycoriella hygida]
YMDLIATLLKFTRSLRDGDWDMYLSSLNGMLPLMARYYHFKYLQSLTTYIYEMNHLPAAVLDSFRKGEFVVKRSKNKRSKSKFNQVDPDHAQECLVRTCKDAGGLLGLMNKDKSMQKWILSFHWKTEIAIKTYSMYEFQSSALAISKGNVKKNQIDENAITQMLTEFNVLSSQSKSNRLQNVATKDLATKSIENSLLNAMELGMNQVTQFVKERFIPCESGKPLKSLLGAKKNMPLTMGDINKKVPIKPTLKNAVKSGINVLQRLVATFESGRSIDLMNILSRELQSVPLSIAEVSGELRSGDDSSFIDMLSKNVQSCSAINFDREYSHLIIDAKKIIQSLTKLLMNSYKKINIIFNQYNTKSIERKNSSYSVRRVIENERVPFPKNWKHFWNNNENKSDLVQFLSKNIGTKTFESADVVVSAGFDDRIEVFSCGNDIDVECLRSNHKITVTRIVLHSVHSSAKTIVVSTNDANTYMLLIRHYGKFQCDQLWLETDSRKNKQIYPIHEIVSQLPHELKANLLAYHSILGSSATVYLAGITKTGSWKLYAKYYGLLTGFRTDSYTNAKQTAEQFVVKLCKVEQGADTADVARYILFRKTTFYSKNFEKLPPTTDSLDLHLKRAFYQNSIWEAATSHTTPPNLVPEEYGWKDNGSECYEPVLMTLPPITEGCLKMISCGCNVYFCPTSHTLRNINDWTIQLGITRRHSHSYYGENMKVRKVIPHPQYNSEVIHDNDIALFQLESRVAFHEHLLPVCLPPDGMKELKPGTSCTVIGWGKKELKKGSAAYEPTVNEVQVPVLHRDLCNEWLVQLNVTEGMICAGYQEGGKDACQGDSGGPLLCRDPNDRERWFVGGIVSWGVKCAHPKLPGVYANVPKYISWIHQQMQKYSNVNIYDNDNKY